MHAVYGKLQEGKVDSLERLRVRLTDVDADPSPPLRVEPLHRLPVRARDYVA